MTTANIGLRQGNTVIPYAAATKRTKLIQLSSTSFITLTGTGLTAGTTSIKDAYMYAYADSTGKWKLNFNFSLSATMTASHTSALITLASTYAVTFKNATTFRQAASAYGTATDTPMTARCNENASTINIFHADVSENSYNVSGDVVLETEPTWAAANMEGVVAADIYINNASTSSVGLVKQGVNVAAAAGATPTKAEFDALLTSLKNAGIIASS